MLSRYSHLVWLLSYFKISCPWVRQSPPWASGTEHEAVNRSENMPPPQGGTPRNRTSVLYPRYRRRQPKKCIHLPGAENPQLGIESQLLLFLPQKLRASLSTDYGGSAPPPGRSQVPGGRKPPGSSSHTTVPLRSADSQPESHSVLWSVGSWGLPGTGQHPGCCGQPPQWLPTKGPSRWTQAGAANDSWGTSEWRSQPAHQPFQKQPVGGLTHRGQGLAFQEWPGLPLQPSHC